MNDPESIASAKWIIFNSPKSTCRFLHPDIGKTNCLNPKQQHVYCPSHRGKNLHPDLGNNPPTYQDIGKKKHFASSDPHHGIQFIQSHILSGKSSGIPSRILFDILSGISSGILSGISIWHSIWHVFWHSICHIFWHSIWHSIWNIFWHSTWHILWHSIWHSIWHIFWHSIRHIFWHSIWHSISQIFWHSIRHIFWHSIWHIFWHIWHAIWSIWHSLFLAVEVRLRSAEAHGAQNLAVLRISPVEVRRGPQRSDSRRLRTTAIKSWQWRSGEAHCDQELADEVRRGPLRSRAGRGGPAKPTAIESWQLRSGEAHCNKSWQMRSGEQGQKEGGGGGGGHHLLKSNNPHLAGGEKCLGQGADFCALTSAKSKFGKTYYLEDRDVAQITFEMVQFGFRWFKILDIGLGGIPK